MAQTDIPTTEDKWVIFFQDSEPIAWFNSALNECTTYNSAAWSVEEYNTEEAWLVRLAELGITPIEE